ncbi:YcjX family protein [Hoeflea sp. YIM 152468]|uniref:YcjX family protein n=1 Tax=Hoeflea sp. YIM 152468 TaxID=3031759 RepID=UPI0023DA60FB|nr:YcjX family protein [Hoeflea sp. YIM 152468]MDF1607435.1 YcjX family protein [Hoeflea sp. YIM 152468]
MSPSYTNLADEALIAFDTLTDRASNIIQPTMRLGVTGLSRAGKTVFITALVHNMLHGGRLPMFEAAHSGRLARSFLEPQPDDAVPRFQYEDHAARMIDERIWPESTRAISELRLVIEYESASGWNRFFSGGRLCLDIVDYPGEWLLDLPLLGQDFAAFSLNASSLARSPVRADLAAPWLEKAGSIDPHKPADESDARDLARLFTDYLRACKQEVRALSTLPPGRFLMPGDLEGSPALTFAPLPNLPDTPTPKGSLRAMMERRFESYKSVVVKPFFREHVARLDRQIVLIDAMQAMNAGREAVIDLERALSDVLSCFRPGSSNLLTSLISRRIDKVLIAATKADHLHHESHDRLEAIARRIVDRASRNIGSSGAHIEVMAIAAVRATREATVRQDGEVLPVIVGTPLEGERIDAELFDGNRKTAIFPGDLPAKPESFFKTVDSPSQQPLPDFNIVRFRPPLIEETETGVKLSLPHIRLDRALQYLLGDRLA